MSSSTREAVYLYPFVQLRNSGLEFLREEASFVMINIHRNPGGVQLWLRVFQLTGNRKLLWGRQFFYLPAVGLFRKRGFGRSQSGPLPTKWG